MSQTVRLIAAVLIVLAQGFFASSGWADRIACGLPYGCLGRIRIGDSSAAVERLIGRKVDLQFAGDGRVGLSLESSKDLRRLGITQPNVSLITAADIFFIVRTPLPVVDMVSLGIPCEDVQRLRAQSQKSGVRTLDAGKGGWRVDRPKFDKYVWGADMAPVCRFWIRGAELR